MKQSKGESHKRRLSVVGESIEASIFDISDESHNPAAFFFDIDALCRNITCKFCIFA